MISCIVGQVSNKRRVQAKTTDLLLEVPPVLFIDEDEVQVIPHAELLVHLAERRRELEAAQEQPYRDSLPCRRPLVSPTVRSRKEGKSAPRTGAPSMISNLVMVSLSLYWFGGAPVVSRRMMESSMCLILMRTSRK